MIGRQARAILIAALGMMSLAAASTSGLREHRAFGTAIAAAKKAMVTSPDKANQAAERAEIIARALPSAMERQRAEGMALWLRAEAVGRMGDPRQALNLLDRATQKVAGLNARSELSAEILLSQGGILTSTGRISEALHSLQRAHNIFVETKGYRGQVKAQILLALLYNNARDRQTALRYFKNATEVRNNDPVLAISILNGQGATYTEVGRYRQAERDFTSAEQLSLRYHAVTAQPIILANLANVHLLQGHLDAAAKVIERGLALTRRTEATFARPTFLALSAQLSLQRGNLARARTIIDQRFAGVDLTRTLLTERADHQTAYTIYAALGEDHLALQHLVALKRLDDQATEVARSNSAALATARFDYANQELRIAKLKADELRTAVAREREDARRQRTIFVSAALGTALLIALLGFGMMTLRRSRNRLRLVRDKLQRALAAKTEFLAATSHEIRTPLNGILGMTQVMIADRQLDAATRDRLSVVHGAGVTMRALVDDILDVAKIETGRMTIESAPFDLRRTIDEACRLWRDQAEAKRLDFVVQMDACPGWITGDAVRLRQIVFNLLSNAVKFTTVGQVSVGVTCSGDRFSVRVADTGIGVAPAAQEIIFHSFRQADAGTTRQFGGTGLGLSICRSLSRAMGGDVTVESMLGKGAVFTLNLPLVSADAPAGAVGTPPILLVVRNPIVRATLEALFEKEGVVAIAGELEDAVRIARSRPLCRVLVDADEATIAAASHLRNLVDAAGEAPVALLTPALTSECRARATATGVQAIIEKPISKAMLVGRVMRLNGALVRGAA